MFLKEHKSKEMLSWKAKFNSVLETEAKTNINGK